MTVSCIFPSVVRLLSTLRSCLHSAQVSRGDVIKSEITHTREDENECTISTSILEIQRLCGLIKLGDKGKHHMLSRHFL